MYPFSVELQSYPQGSGVSQLKDCRLLWFRGLLLRKGGEVASLVSAALCSAALCLHWEQ